jgi:bifunctional pyridoxal-dependent enzyme with beta-cystathionase and maltose regulon repressor activities
MGLWIDELLPCLRDNRTGVNDKLLQHYIEKISVTPSGGYGYYIDEPAAIKLLEKYHFSVKEES